MTAVILAGGQGTRIRTLFPDVPKPLIPVAGRPFLDWLTLYLAAAGLRSFVYSTGYKGSQIDDWCRDDAFPGCRRISVHERELLGTGGGLLNCLDEAGDWILVANGDGVCMTGIDRLLALRHVPGVDGGLIGVHVPDTSAYGSLDSDDDGKLVRFREKQPGTGYVNSGIYLFRKSALMPLRRQGVLSLERDLIPEMLAAGRNFQVVHCAQAPFIDIGTPEAMMRANDFVTTHLAHLAPC
ncbi:D-glycero-alpha-D-manno-heptose 1-phosphate guanylyltransferase [Bosea sp. 62]|uniref:sugar phosphate nucleotidyltransferase n=1 Tax=unclassified Bosea (in: a-proteobacteria) TaxID=2653178 RepID=UPI0012575A59|nr:MULTISPECIES: sugar phosphate nucleotidyltransferase [unclassified Bosea (in: a-proteobacteria)]CAD5293037.1 D-glycero-alpha-D-manno-heptose 1-phosphate guanylyltransferase [Bosea sp. 21B]CAD5293607.1 D-glycero-alpha-D-manno-heptose 1-phosphate guanylyltransferase [Bosea sp. 46]CAD5299523.1 D-glycero-alpha-D-manno-heptose 1-phosphate guanylyltransferase [Bosea sp. 7B]VVT62209.1 D-glycero-alpha-D-manno-heptose 1-phosphate guanylyltransferase [Bosea sp. EC-HK365B]VXB09432.1 D-glycero-alpha-D-